MLTVQRVVLDLLGYIGVTGFTEAVNEQALNRPGLDDENDIDKALTAVNQAIQTINKYGPLAQEDVAAFFHAPITVTGTATHGGGIVFDSVPDDWVQECAIQIEGDAYVNRITNQFGATSTLLRGYTGPTGHVSATIYANACVLPASVKGVGDPVYCESNATLQLRMIGPEQMSSLSMWRAVTGVPAYYLVRTRRSDGLLVLVVSPFVGAATNIMFNATLRADERVDRDGLGLADGVDPEVAFATVPEDDVESVLLPLARWYFFAHPSLKNAEARVAVKADYDRVMPLLMSGFFADATPGAVTRVRCFGFSRSRRC